MILDLALADIDTNIGHESGEWRPMIKVPEEATEDFSFHHPGSSYYPGDATLGAGGGDPSPTGTGTSPKAITVADAGIPSVDTGARTTQAQHVWAPPESPSNTQRVNSLEPGVLNSLGTYIFTKPAGVDTIIIKNYLKISDAIPAGKTIELNVILAAWDGNKGPVIISKQAIRLDEDNMVPGEYRVARRLFTGYSRKPLMVTGYLERRNDVENVPQTQVWVVKTGRIFINRELTR